MLTFLFPGQGSQFKGMGGTLFDEFSNLTQKADALLGYSIKKLCLEDPEQQLNQTQFTQPAIYIVSALNYLKKIQETNLKPDYAAGHSLGEYSALFAADVFDFETGIKLVKKRGELMSKAEGGGMAAIMGLTAEKIQEIIAENNLLGITIANFNSDSQSVISGLKNDIEHAQSIFKNFSATFIPLKVSGAFHSHLMETAHQEFNIYLQQFVFNIPSLPVLANVNAKPYHPLIIQKNLSDQMTHSVQWTQTIRYLLSQGAMEFAEIGPGNVLTGLLKNIQN